MEQGCAKDKKHKWQNKTRSNIEDARSNEQMEVSYEKWKFDGIRTHDNTGA